MPRPRHPKPRAQQAAREGCPGRGAHRGGRRGSASEQQPQLRAARGARRSGDSGSSGSGAEWWQPARCQVPPPELGLGRRAPPLRLPPLSPNATVAQRAARNRAVLRSVLLPPLRPEPPRPAPPARAAPRADSLGAILGELLPSKFREFLRHLNELSESVEQSPPPTPPDSRRRRCVPDPCVHRCPRCSCVFLPDLRDQSLHLQDSCGRSLLHPAPVCSLKKPAELTTVKQAQSRCAPEPRLKAALSQSSSSGQSSGSSRRSRPYRVRFADETLGDSALRYWERSYAARQNLSSGPAASPERRRQSPQWLEEQLGAWRPQAEDPCSWSAQELSEDAHETSPPPFTSRAGPQSPWGNPKTPLHCHGLLDLLGKPPWSWSRRLGCFLPSLVLNTILK